MNKGSVVALLPAVFFTMVLGACSPDNSSQPAVGAPAPGPMATVVGKPVDCLPLQQFNETRIRDDNTIDFIGLGGKAWRVTMSNRCNGLRAANTFTYETSLSQLCRQDIIYPLNNYGGSLQRGPGCGLAPFVPVKLEK